MSNSPYIHKLLARTTVLYVDPVSHENICSDLTDYPLVLNCLLFLSVLSSMTFRFSWCFSASDVLLPVPAYD